MKSLLLVLCFTLVWATAGQAADRPLPIQGPLEQGGLIFGQVAPGSQVWLDGQALRVSPDGLFLFGLDRDAAAALDLRIQRPDGERWHRVLSVAPRSYRVQRIDGLPQSKVVPPEETWDRILAEIDLMKAVRTQDTPQAYFASGFIWPVRGRISGVYGSQRVLNGEPRQPHYGIDIAAPSGTLVRAPADGVVSFSHPGLYFAGKTLTIDHGHGLQSTLIHLSESLVEEGQVVRQGDPVAKVGATGRATGPHLDWRVSWFDRWIDPRQLVE